MMRCSLAGVGHWSPGLPDWPAAAAAFRGGSAPPPADAPRPAAALLPPAERRRVPETVAAALQAATEALAASGLDAAQVASVFTSAYGDLALLDQLCSAIASPRPMVSPTRFHNSVHNAAAGYWSIATRSMRSTSAVSAFDCSFGAGLLEAAALCASDQAPVLLVAFDGPTAGALASVAHSEGLLALALVLLPAEGADASLARLAFTVSPGTAPRKAATSAAARALRGNAMADALTLGEVLARGAPAEIDLPLADNLALRIGVAPQDAAAIAGAAS